MNLDILKLINDNNDISQRKISEKLNISLGKVNSLIKELKENQYINISVEGNNTRYELTKYGLTYLENLLNEQKRKRLNLHKDENKIVKEAVILAAGYNEYFDQPPGFLQIEEFKVVERIVKQLRNNGIEKIVIVTGYKENYYKQFAKEYNNIYCISNEQYKWTGSMYSLALAKKYIKEDFILIENDLIFEDRVIEKLISNENRDCIVLTTESGSGDEAFVEIRDGYLYKMSKDIHQFNRIDGEMIGISKISYKLYNLMLKEFCNNENSYMNYEYAMLDVARNYKVGYLKINDLVWGEIDNTEQYERVKNYIYPIIKRKEIHYKIDKIKKHVENGLNVPANSIKEVEQIGGMTNKNYRVLVDNSEYILRIAGTGTEEMINRHTEMVNSKLAADYGIDADIVYFNENTGVKISKMIKEAETLNPETAKRKKNIDKVANILKKLHNSNICMENEFDVFLEIKKYEHLANKVNAKFYDNYYEVKEQVMKLKKTLKEFGFKLIPSHNDTVAENFIKDTNGKIYLIDWEYSGLNDNMWDLSAYVLENDLTQEQEELLQSIYLGRVANKNEKIRVIIHKICQDFLWSIWTIIKEAQGESFGDYGVNRFKRCRENLDLLKSMLITK